MFRKIKRYLKDPYYALGYDMIQKCPHWMSDKFYLKVLWKQRMGYELDLKNPKTFTEKLQWLKLYDRNPLYTTLVDKYRVKQWVTDKIGEQYVIPTLKVYQSVDEIDLDELPNQFVLKCNHDSGSVVICRDKSQFDLQAAKEKLDAGLQHNFYWNAREWPYKNVKRCIFAEQYLESAEKSLVDYKFFCFDGEPKYCQVICGRYQDKTVDFYDMSWNHMTFVGLNPNYKNCEVEIPCPKNFDSMIEKAKILSSGNPFTRIDFYDEDDTIKIGEITLFPAGGFGTFNDCTADEKIGRMINVGKKYDHSGGGHS